MSKKKQPKITPDYVFGTLTPDAIDLENKRRERRGLWHEQQLRPLDPRPGDPVTITISAGPDISADHVTLYYTTNGTVPDSGRGQAQGGMVIEMERVSVEWDMLVGGYRDNWEGVLPPQPKGTHVQYVIKAWHSIRSESYYAGETDTPQVYGFYVDDEEVPTWSGQAVIYHILIDRFAPDPGTSFNTPPNAPDGFYGGTLRGIVCRLDYLADLGITCLWLSPVFPSPTYHGYDSTDYGTIEPRLGSEEDWQVLLDEAHKRGMRVILDYVANHVSSKHPAFVAAQKDKRSPTAQWFHFNHWPHDYDTFFGVREMPKVNTDNAAARAYMIDHARQWLERGCDGFRLDHVNGPTHAFWSAFRTATRAVKPDSVLFGEDVEAPMFQRAYAGRMDGCLDFLLHQALRKFFSFDTLKPSQFDAFLQRHFTFFPDNYVQPSFLDNHDMNRFLWTARGDKRRLRLAALCQFTLPAPPIIYYGTEVGLNQQNDVGCMEEARLPMLWGKEQDQDLLAFYKALIALRLQGEAVWWGPRQILLIDDERHLYAYACDPYAVAFNNSRQKVTISLTDWQKAELALATEIGVSWQPHKGELILCPFSGGCLHLR
jgi:cyclomaltodextrinase